ncbi:TIGR04540 family protein [Paenibacillus elgii]|uniref:TIGR04540 family protein n=1 Tax=Paenibacillus elgii TaxID=189691 RepID=UPI000248CED9|nr:TIGR04540 family protein [Paenibacillus elgii]
MEIKRFYKTQRELASTLNNIVDAYWENMISEEELIANISEVYCNNTKKILKQNDFTTILKQQCGKRRLEVIERVLHINDLLNNEKSIG